MTQGTAELVSCDRNSNRSVVCTSSIPCPSLNLLWFHKIRSWNHLQPWTNEWHLSGCLLISWLVYFPQMISISLLNWTWYWIIFIVNRVNDILVTDLLVLATWSEYLNTPWLSHSKSSIVTFGTNAFYLRWWTSYSRKSVWRVLSTLSHAWCRSLYWLYLWWDLGSRVPIWLLQSLSVVPSRLLDTYTRNLSWCFTWMLYLKRCLQSHNPLIKLLLHSHDPLFNPPIYFPIHIYLILCFELFYNNIQLGLHLRLKLY